MSDPGSWHIVQAFKDFVRIYGYENLSQKTQLDKFFQKYPKYAYTRQFIEITLKKGASNS